MSQLAPGATSSAPAAYRSRLYALLSAAYRYPSAEWCQVVACGQFQARVQQAAAGLPYPLPSSPDSPELKVLSPESRGSTQDSALSTQDSALRTPQDSALALPLSGLSSASLATAYTHLFDVGSLAGPPCCLYEGEYGGGRLGVMEDALRFYRFFGLRRSPEARERPDHLAVELEFLHWLAFQEAGALGQGDAAAAEPYRAATRDFLAAHTRELAEQVAAHLAERDAPFYPGLARLAAEFCAQDLEYLQGAPVSASPRLRVPASEVPLELHGLREAEPAVDASLPYSLQAVRTLPLPWDRVVKASHMTNCWYQRACAYNLFVSDGVVLREEQVGNYPPLNDPLVPDRNPRGCQKGACYTHRTYDPARLKYPLKRVGERGGGRWERISWDQALAEIADGLLDILTTDGPETILQGGGTRITNNATESVATNAFFEALGCPLPGLNVEIGDDHQGAAITLGKIIFTDSADNWFHADTILVWGGNPAYTNIPNYHYIAEARYRGARVIALAPDYNPSAIHADLWVPLNIGTDAALALAMAQVILEQRLFKEDFVREQTDLPLLVRADTGRFLRERDLKRGEREDIFYLYDQAAGRVAEAPRKSLALGSLVPALEGEYQVQTVQGPVRVRPVFELLRDHLDRRFTPQQASAITGVPAGQIEALAREVATAQGVVNITTSNLGKFYHGDLMERAIILVFALCGHMGRKGASYNAFPALALDTALGALERHGQRMLTAAAASDPRYAAWKEDGYTTEMILAEYTKQAVALGAVGMTNMVHYFHGGVAELSERHQSWDPHLKRPLGEYVREAFAKGWQVVVPPVEKAPRAMFHIGGNAFRRARATKQLLETLLPKLKLMVTIDTRMCSSALYSDYVLPACGWYERTSVSLFDSPLSPFTQLNDRAVDPLYESLNEWVMFVRLARKLSERARARGITSFRDKDGKERRLDRLEDVVTVGGLYAEDDDEALARDAFTNCGNLERMSWEEFKERGIAAYTNVGTGARSIGNACDITPGEPLVPLTWHTERKEPYPTLTRRIQFYLDHDWYLELEEHLPTHKEPPKAGGDYPLQVTGGHARWSIHSDWIDDSLLLGLQRGEPALFVSVEDARTRDIADGDFVEVYNDVGNFRVQVAVSPAVRPGQVMIYHAWENFQFQGWRHFKRVMPSPLNPIELVGDYGHIRPDVLSLTPGPNDRGTRVEVRKALS